MGISGLSALGAALGGIGGFAGGTASALEEQRKEALAQQKLDQEQQYRDAELTLRRDTLNQSATPAAQLFGYLGMPLPATLAPETRVPNVIADNLLKAAADQQKVKREQQLASDTGAFLTRAKGQPAQLQGQLGAEEDPEAAALIPRSSGAPPMSQWDVGAGLAGLGHTDTGLGALMKTLYPEPKERAQPNATAQIMAAAAEVSRRLDAGETEDTSPELRSLMAQLNVAKIVAGQPQGEVFGAGGLAFGNRSPAGGAAPAPPSAPSQPGAPSPPPGGPKPLISIPGVPSPGERKDIADVDARIASFTQLAAAAESPEIQAMLGLKGMPSRLGEDWLKMDNLTPAQREFRARSRIELTAASRIMIGVGQTNSELTRLAPALPGENDPGFAPKMRAWAAWAQQNREGINNALTGSNVRVPPQMAPKIGEPGYTGRSPGWVFPEVVPGKNGISIDPNAKIAPKLQPGERFENGEIVSESGQYAFRNGQWIQR